MSITKVSVNDANEKTGVSIDDTLSERGVRYGSFSRHAAISQDLQRVIARYHGYEKFTDAQSEAISMILHKIARIVNGDPNYDDSWRDIAGYAQLIVDNLNGKDT